MDAKGVRVLYFADAARRVGVREELLGPPFPATLGELQSHVFEQHPELRELQESLLWSVDEEVAGPETLLVDGSVVGALPPFSGG